MKKVVSILLALSLMLGVAYAFSGCSGDTDNDGKFTLALITDGSPVNDKGYNEYAWNGLKSYAEKNDVSYRYYQPSLDENGDLTPEEISKYVDTAVKDGAKQIVLPGEKFSTFAYEYAPTYSNVQFYLIDAYPHTKDDNSIRMQSNVECVSFNKIEAGFLAGYSAFILGSRDANGKLVRKYNTKLGYLGSVATQDAADYGSGYVQGASYAANQKGVPAALDYAEYDSLFLDYDYSFTVKPVYIKRSESDKKTYKVKVIDGIGSGAYNEGENVTITANPAPEGKVFDHWDIKSNTKGVKDKKVNVSSKKDPSINLIVEDCDCTITAVWADADTVPVTVAATSEGETDTIYYAPKNSDFAIEAPAAQNGMVFDHWESNTQNVLEDAKAENTNVKVGKDAIYLTPVYVESENPTFNVTVEQGSGTGSYVTGDEVKVVADPPQDGYMFYKWDSVDNQGLSTGVAFENEYCYHTTFEMPDRYASIAEKMYDGGTEVIFAGGNPVSDSIFSASEKFDTKVYTFGYGIDEGSKSNCIASVVTDYGKAINLALSEFKGGSFFIGNIENGCIYVTGLSDSEYQLDDNGKPKEDKDGNKIKDENYNADYANVIKQIKDGKIKLINAQKGYDVRKLANSKCLSVDYWVLE